MNIGIVCYPTFGGSGIVATELGMQLAIHGHHVDFISYKVPARLEFVNSNIHFHQVFVEDYPLFQHQPYVLALATKIGEAVLSHQLEILHVHYAIPHAFAACMARDMLRDKGKEIKIVTTLHGTDITLVGSHPSYKMAVEYSINHSDAVTSVSESLRNSTYEDFEIKKDIEVISNFIDTEKIRSEGKLGCVRENFVDSPDEKLVVHISNLRPVKRVQDVIAVFNNIQKEVNSKLLILGEGPDLELSIQLVKQYGIESKVKFLGNHNNIYAVLCAADLVLLPSQTESFGLVALEAMATETPVIASNAGGLPEVVLDGETGYLCEVGDIDDMSKKAINLLKNDPLLTQMKKAAVKRADFFDVKKIVPIYEGLYERCLNS